MDALGLEKTDRHIVTIEVPMEAPPEASLRVKVTPAAQDTSISTYRNDFNFDLELKKSKLVNAIHLLREPLMETIEAVKQGGSRLLYLPCILDYYADEIASPRVVASVEVKPKSETYLTASFGNDKSYATRRRQAEHALHQNNTHRDSETVSQVFVPPPHARFALELLGSIPWPTFAISTKHPLKPTDQRYHRRHLFCRLTDSPDVPWPVSSPHKHPVTELVDGQCPYRSIDDVSLRDTSRFLLVEWTEENPLVMHTVGMSATLSRFWRHRSHLSAKTPDPVQVESLGPFGHLRKLEVYTLPRVYGGNIIRMESHCTLFESTLVRAPLFVHKASRTDFLLVRYRSGSRYHCVLRPIDCVYVGGQMEPQVRIEAPLHPRLTAALRARIFVEARRFWASEKKLISTELVRKLFPGEHKGVITRFTQEANREVGENPDLPFSPGNATPEDHCRLEAMKEGLRRLKARGIANLCCMQLFRVRQYVKEIEAHEQFLTDPQNKVAYECMQLEHELQISTWNLSSDYHDVLSGRKGLTFAFTPIGDPSGGRGEAVSFIRNSREGTGGPQRGAAVGLEGDLRTKTKSELIRDLRAKGVPESVYGPMSRWQMLKHLTSLVANSVPSNKLVENRIPLYQRRQLQVEKLNSIWWKQTVALSSSEPPKYDNHETSAQDDKSDDDEAANDLLADLMGDEPAALPPPSDDDEAMTDDEEELHAFRNRLNKPIQIEVPAQPIQTSNDPPQSGEKVARLKVVHTGREKTTGSPWTRTTYVYGRRNIELYRRWRKLNYAVTGQFDQDVSTEERKPNWEELVEAALRRHKQLQQELAAKLIAATDPKVKRCAACHWLGHDASSRGCPMYPRDEEEEQLEEEEDDENLEIGDGSSPASDDFLQPVVDDNDVEMED